MTGLCFSTALPDSNIRCRRSRARSIVISRSILRNSRSRSVAGATEGVMRSIVSVAFAVMLATIGGAAADTFPTHPITIVVPFSAGGPSDAMARILAERMKAILGQTVLVENVTGAGGSIGVGRAVHSPPDGYTVSFGHLGTH